MFRGDFRGKCVELGGGARDEEDIEFACGELESVFFANPI